MIREQQPTEHAATATGISDRITKGAVWVAEQSQPVKRKVVLKLIKAGMDSKTVLARFEAERQALAVMDHPNIAKVLEGGLTEQGRPFFVMEYVKGISITEYCDAKKLSVPERLQLFAQVCQAVQHAHQKGISHRDLKPSNILVAPYDDKPVPTVIDFGLAKAIHQSLTERNRSRWVVRFRGWCVPQVGWFEGSRRGILRWRLLANDRRVSPTPTKRERLRPNTPCPRVTIWCWARRCTGLPSRLS